MTKANNWRLFSVTSIDDQGLMLVVEHINISKNVAAVLCDSSEMGHSVQILHHLSKCVLQFFSDLVEKV